MIRSWRSPLLAIALAAFAFQVGSAANVRCELAAAASASHHGGGHGTAHQSSSHSEPSGHQPGCVCVAGCSVASKLARAAVAIPQNPIRAWLTCVPVSEPAEPLPLAARPFVLPLANAPPLPA